MLPRSRWRRPGRAPLILVLDLIVVVAVTTAVMIVVARGVDTTVRSIGTQPLTPTVPAAIAAVALAIRGLFARGHGLFGRAAGDWFVPTLDQRPPATGGWASDRTFALAVLGYAAIAAVLLHRQLAEMHAVADLGDPLFSIWRIGWVFHQLRGDPRALFDANIFHPEPLTLTYSDAMLLPALMAAPLLAAGVPSVVTYNVLMISAFLASAAATYVLVARLTGSRQAAFIAGLLYGFHPYRFEHYHHLELQMTFWMPLALASLHRFVDRRRITDAVIAALCTVAQLYSSMYYAVFFVIVAPVMVLGLVVLRRERLQTLLAGALTAAAIGAVLAWPLADAYAGSQVARGDRPISVVKRYSATLGDYVRPHARSAFYDGRLPIPLEPERALMPGLSLPTLAAVALIPPVGPVRAAYLGAAVVAFDLSTGLNGAMYAPLYEVLAPLRGMRVPSRMSIVLGLVMAVLAGFGAARLLERQPSASRRRFAFAVLVGLAVIELRPSLTLVPVWPEPPSVYTAIADRRDAVIAEFPFRPWRHDTGWSEALPQMYFSTWHGHPLVNGYSGNFPASYVHLLERLGSFPDAASLDALRARGVTHIAVTCALTRDRDRCDGLTTAVESSAAARAIAADMWEGYPATLYELLPGPQGSDTVSASDRRVAGP